MSAHRWQHIAAAGPNPETDPPGAAMRGRLNASLV